MHKHIDEKSGLIFLVPDVPQTDSVEELHYYFAEYAFAHWANNLNFKEIRYELEHGMARRIYVEEVGYSDRYHRWYSIKNIVTSVIRSRGHKAYSDEQLMEIVDEFLPLFGEMTRQRIGNCYIVQDEDDPKTIHFDRQMTEEETEKFLQQLNYEYILDLKLN